ncbi:hypothetical protein ACWD4P_12720 [Kitasatospora sp. NPDC002543]
MTTYDRDAARERIRERRPRTTALAISRQVRKAAAVARPPELADLLNEIATDMDTYVGTEIQVTGGPGDVPVHAAAQRLARHILAEPPT